MRQSFFYSVKQNCTCILKFFEYMENRQKNLLKSRIISEYYIKLLKISCSLCKVGLRREHEDQYRRLLLWTKSMFTCSPRETQI